MADAPIIIADEDDEAGAAWWMPFVFLAGFILMGWWVYDKVDNPGLIRTGGIYLDVGDAGHDSANHGDSHGVAAPADHAVSEADHNRADHGAAVTITDLINQASAADGAYTDAADHTLMHGASAVENVAAEMVNDSAGPTLGFTRRFGDFELRGADSGAEAALIGFIESDRELCTQSDCWFALDRLTFNTGSADVDQVRSAAQLENLFQIMQAFQTIELKFGGYTDNRGDEDLNISLSQRRAEAVVAILVARGISADRLGAEGYGSQFPAASNETAEGRAQNRRVMVRLRGR